MYPLQFKKESAYKYKFSSFLSKLQFQFSHYKENTSLKVIFFAVSVPKNQFRFESWPTVF